MHVQSGLIKPSLVDAHWTESDIGWVAVTVGTAMGLFGAFVGGLAHRAMVEARALVASGVAHAVVCVPVIWALSHGAPKLATGVAVACEHFASGFGTTILFAALMSATRPRDAGFHYTILTSANSVAIGLGGLIGGIVADHTSKTFAFALGGAISLAPLVFVREWRDTARASASEE
jgi:predicted MFS family arabinose efflux permease